MQSSTLCSSTTAPVCGLNEAACRQMGAHRQHARSPQQYDMVPAYRPQGWVYSRHRPGTGYRQGLKCTAQLTSVLYTHDSLCHAQKDAVARCSSHNCTGHTQMTKQQHNTSAGSPVLPPSALTMLHHACASPYTAANCPHRPIKIFSDFLFLVPRW